MQSKADNVIPGDTMKNVLMEVRMTKGLETMQVFEMATSAFNNSGFQLDTSYEPIPMSPDTPELQAQLQSTNEEIVIVRGSIEAQRIPELEAQPNVLSVWDDAPIAPFSTTLLKEEGALVEPTEALGTCPIGTCDCSSGTAKGTIADVAQYLGVEQIWANGHRGEGVVVGVVDGGITAEGRPVGSGETSRRIPRVIGGWPTSNWGTKAARWREHGNMVATDVLGMAPQAKLYPTFRTLNCHMG